MNPRVCVVLLVSLCLMGRVVFGQAVSVLSRSIAVNEALFQIDRLQRYMCLIGECPLPPLASRTEIFAPEALIFTSSKFHRELDYFQPESYFRRVNGFVCHHPQKYRYLRYSYKKLNRSMARIMAVSGNKYLVCVKIDQKFQAGASETQITYSDDTIKEIYVRVYINEEGNIESRIVQIMAERPGPYS